MSVVGGDFTNSGNGGDCPAAALQDDPAFSGSIYDVIVVSRGKVTYKAHTSTYNYIHTQLNRVCGLECSKYPPQLIIAQSACLGLSVIERSVVIAIDHTYQTIAGPTMGSGHSIWCVCVCV